MLFDVDGTLVDTTYLHAVCWGEALRQHGHDIPMADVHHAIGMSGDKMLDRFLGEDRDEEGDAIDAAHLALYKQHWGRLRATAGCGRPAPRLRRARADVVLASSASEEELAALRSALDADDAITAATSPATPTRASRRRTSSQTALEKSGLDADRAVFVGDAVWDGTRPERDTSRSSASPAEAPRPPICAKPARSRCGATRRSCSTNFDKSALGALLGKRGLAMPQQAWNKKRERQYEHIKEGLTERGRDEDTAEEIAARTVNKERARAGEAKQKSKTSTDDISSSRRGGLRSHSGSGGRTKAQLYEEAKKKNVEGRSSMTKAELERAVGRR